MAVRLPGAAATEMLFVSYCGPDAAFTHVPLSMITDGPHEPGTGPQFWLVTVTVFSRCAALG
jgi:hypothetical protein